MTEPEVRCRQAGKRILDIDETSSGGLHQNTQCARNGQPLITRDADAESLVHEQQVGAFLLGQLNGLAFSWIESPQCRIDLRCCGPNDQPGRRGREPALNGGNRPWVAEFVEDGGGHQDFRVQRGEDVCLFNLNEVVERRRVGDDDDHGRGMRPLASSCSRVARSCSRASTS